MLVDHFNCLFAFLLAADPSKRQCEKVVNFRNDFQFIFGKTHDFGFFLLLYICENRVSEMQWKLLYIFK